jgi:hypothetical protein
MVNLYSVILKYCVTNPTLLLSPRATTLPKRLFTKQHSTAKVDTTLPRWRLINSNLCYIRDTHSA